MVLVMLGQDYCLNSGQERMDSMKSWAGIETFAHFDIPYFVLLISPPISQTSRVLGQHANNFARMV